MFRSHTDKQYKELWWLSWQSIEESYDTTLEVSWESTCIKHSRTPALEHHILWCVYFFNYGFIHRKSSPWAFWSVV